MSTARRSAARTLVASTGPTPTSWRFFTHECSLPRNVRERWDLPGAGSDQHGDWTLIVHHQADGRLTHSDQWVEDDPAGRLAIQINGAEIPLLPGNVAAHIRMDASLHPAERQDLTGGIGFFSDVARCARWLSCASDAERRRRLATAVQPERLPQVLTTDEAKDAAVVDIQQRIRGEDSFLAAPTALGYLLVASRHMLPDAANKLYLLASLAVAAPETTATERLALCTAIGDWRQEEKSTEKYTPAAICIACCMTVSCMDTVIPQDIRENAEKLLAAHAEKE